MKKSLFLTDMQLRSQLARCEYCEQRSCQEGCPADCSPFDFIMAAGVGLPQDIRRSAALIMKNNPLGGVCGAVCPEKHCMARCSHKDFDGAVRIPDLQASIVERAKDLGGIPAFRKTGGIGKKVAVIGAGPAGLAAAAVLAQRGLDVVVYESSKGPGGMCNLIPAHRLPRKVLLTDIDFIRSLGNIVFRFNSRIDSPEELFTRGYAAVIVAAGLWIPIMPGARNQEKAITAVDYLADPGKYPMKGRVAVIGGGAAAVDCAVTARMRRAQAVEMVALESVAELPLTPRERKEIIDYGIEVTGRTKVLSIKTEGRRIRGIRTVKVRLAPGKKFSLKDIKDIKGTEQNRNDIDHVIIAVGNRPSLKKSAARGLFYAGDMVNGPTTVVEAVASGKNAALQAESYMLKNPVPKIKKSVKSTVSLEGYVHCPVKLETDFFSRKISTPFLLSASPVSDGYDQMRKAYEAGWSGGVMKTAFDNVPIHIPSEYMHVFAPRTYGNCDNVSGHSLDRVCSEVERLVKEFPLRLTMVSTGGSVTGNDESDCKVWQSNTRKLEQAGVMGIEYSLSCPQGGEGTEGDIVSQSAALTAKIIDWVMQTGSSDVPKLFKLTASVTSIATIVRAVKEVLDRYPGKKAGITLANTFPVLGFQARDKKGWEDGVVLGMSGEGVTPISYFTLANAVPVGVTISGNGGPMDYIQAANFLALGVNSVQFCTIVMKYGYGIFSELCSGVSNLMKERGIKSMRDLIGIAQPGPITDFMALSPVKKISDREKDLCLKCGNCTRCPYLAVTLDKDGYPETDPSKCIGCSICTKKCFTGSLYMRERTPSEARELKED